MRPALLAVSVLLSVAGCTAEPDVRRDDVGGGGSGGGGGGSGGTTPTPLHLEVVAAGFPWLTDLAFLPGSADVLVVSDNLGAASWISLVDGSTGAILQVAGIDETREGLLGFAFHPNFPADPRLFVHYALAGATTAEDVIRLAAFTIGEGEPVGSAGAEEVLLEITAPLPNHNGGQVAFGPDGFLWAAFGDGSTVEAPSDASQRPDTLLGKLVRIDVDSRAAGEAYAIPADNPDAAGSAMRPEIWASGFRNPWRFSFDPAGRPVVADVGADGWEEISIVSVGENHGWNVMEGSGCFPSGVSCDATGFALPTFAYPHAEAGDYSITGGYVYQGSKLPALRGMYVFADFEQGTIHAVDLGAPAVSRLVGDTSRQIVAFGRDAEGELYLGDFASGEILRLDGIDPRQPGQSDPKLQ